MSGSCVISHLSTAQADKTAPGEHRCMVVGVGLRAQAQPAALQALWAQALDSLQSSAMPGSAIAHPCAIAVLDTKARHPAVAAWQETLAAKAPCPAVLPVSAAHMASQRVATQSPRLQARYGTGSVAEAAALAVAGPQADLIVPRLVAADGSATLAVAMRRAGHPAGCIAAAAIAQAAEPSQGATA